MGYNGDKVKIYLAGPLFSLAEREFNKKIAIDIMKDLPNAEVILPQEFLRGFSGKDGEFFREMFELCLNSIKRCDVVIANLDGPDADSGTCIELGIAYAINKPVIGIRTDLRSLEDEGVNLMVSKVCTYYLHITDKEIVDYPFIVCNVIAAIKNLTGAV